MDSGSQVESERCKPIYQIAGTGQGRQGVGLVLPMLFLPLAHLKRGNRKVHAALCLALPRAQTAFNLGGPWPSYPQMERLDQLALGIYF